MICYKNNLKTIEIITSGTLSYKFEILTFKLQHSIKNLDKSHFATLFNISFILICCHGTSCIHVYICFKIIITILLFVQLKGEAV